MLTFTSHGGHRRTGIFSHRTQQWRNCRAKCIPAATVELDTLPDVVSSSLAFETKEGVPVQVLGVDHLAMQYDLGVLWSSSTFLLCMSSVVLRQYAASCKIGHHAGEFILASQPHSVVMESTMSPEFGSTTGNTLTSADADSGRSDQTGLRIIFAVSEFLRSVQNPAQSA